MPHGQPSRRSFFGWLGAAFAALFAAREAKAVPPPEATPPVPPLPAGPLPACTVTTYSYDPVGRVTAIDGRPVERWAYQGTRTEYATYPGPSGGALPLERLPSQDRCPCAACPPLGPDCRSYRYPASDGLAGESYRVVLEGGRRLVRVTTTDSSGKVTKSVKFPTNGGQ